MNTYLAFLFGKKIVIKAETLYDARLKAEQQFRVKKRDKSLLAVELAQVGEDKQVALSTSAL